MTEIFLTHLTDLQKNYNNNGKKPVFPQVAHKHEYCILQKEKLS